MDSTNILKLIFKYPKVILAKLYSSGHLNNISGIEELLNKYQIPLLNKKPALISPNEYFKVTLETRICSQSLIEEIKNNFNPVVINNFEFYVLVDYFEDLVLQYGKNKSIDWNSIYQNANINWNRDLLHKYRDIWDWNSLHRNKHIDWTFDIIKDNADYLNWSFISSYENLPWTPEMINLYKNKIVFSLWALNWEKPGVNLNGDMFEIFKHWEEPHGKNPTHYYSFLGGSLCLNKGIKWNKPLIDTIGELINWNELSLIINDIQLIKDYEDKWNWDVLSQNANLPWNFNLLDSYANKWNWKYLSGNPNLPWNFELLKKYEDRWNWRPEEFLSWIVTNVSISSNLSITWDRKMLQEWKDKLDLNTISIKANILCEAALFLKDEFDIYKFQYKISHVHSDRDDTYIYRNGWENLANNINFKLQSHCLQELYNCTTILKNNYDLKGEEKVVRLLELLKNKQITNLTQSDIIEVESPWLKILLNKTFINDSVLDLITQHIDKDNLQCIATKLIEKLNNE